jgi:hypothetical protein
MVFQLFRKRKRNAGRSELDSGERMMRASCQFFDDVSDIMRACRVNEEGAIGEPNCYRSSRLPYVSSAETAAAQIAFTFVLYRMKFDQLAGALAGCKTVVCEAQYRHSDLELARRNYHMTTVLSARLAAQAKVGNLVLFHLSDRYDQTEWAEMLAEARAGLSKTSYPDHWDISP